MSFGVARVEATDLCNDMHIPLLVEGWVSVPDAFAQSVEIGLIEVAGWTQDNEVMRSSVLVEFLQNIDSAHIQGGNNTFAAAVSVMLPDTAALGDGLSRFLNEAPLDASLRFVLPVTLHSFGIPISHTLEFTYHHACGFPPDCPPGGCTYACSAGHSLEAARAQAASAPAQEAQEAAPPAEAQEAAPPAEDGVGCDLLSLRLWDGRGAFGDAEAGRELMVGSVLSCVFGMSLLDVSLPETFVEVFFSEEAHDVFSCGPRCPQSTTDPVIAVRIDPTRYAGQGLNATLEAYVPGNVTENMPELQSMVRTTWDGKESYFYVRGDQSQQTCALNRVLSQMPPYRIRNPRSVEPASGAQRRLSSSPSLVAHGAELIRVVNTTVGALLNYSVELPIELSGQLPAIHVNATMNGLACGVVSTSPADLGRLGQGPTGLYAEATAVDLDVVLGKLWTMQSTQDLELAVQVREGDSLLGDMLAGLRFYLTDPVEGTGRRLPQQPKASGEGLDLDASLEVDSTPEAVLVQGSVSMNLGLAVEIRNATFQLRDHLDRPAASVLMQSAGSLAGVLAVSYSIRVEGQGQAEAARAILQTLAGRQDGSVGLRHGRIARSDDEFFWAGAGLSARLDGSCRGQGPAECAVGGRALRDRIACLAGLAALQDGQVGPACADALALASGGAFDVLIPSSRGLLGVLGEKREELFPAHVWNRSSQGGSQGGSEEEQGGQASVQLELRRLVSSGGPLDLDCLTSWPPCEDQGDPTSLDVGLGSSYSLGRGATGVRLALSVPRGLRVAVGCECSEDAAGAIITVERLQMADGWLSAAPLNITVPDVAKGLWVAYNFSSPAAGQSLCIHTPQSDGGLLSFIMAGVPVVVGAAPFSSIQVGESASAARRVLQQEEDAAWGSIGSTRVDIEVHSADESIDLAVAIRYPSIGVANLSMNPVALSVGPFQLSGEPDPMEHHGQNALLDCYRGGRSCDVMKLWTPEVLATASSSNATDGQESSFGLSIVAPDGGELIAHLFWEWSREKQQAYRVQGAITGEGLVDVSFLWPRFLLPSSLLDARPGRRLVSEDTVGLEVAFNLTDPWDGSELLHGTTTGGMLRSVYFTGVNAFVDPTGERPSQVAAEMCTGWAVDTGDVDVRLTIPTIKFDFSGSYGNESSSQMGHLLLDGFEFGSSKHDLTLFHAVTVEDLGSVIDFGSAVRSGAPAELIVRCGQPGNSSSLLDTLLGKLDMAVSMHMLSGAAQELPTETHRRLTPPDDAPSVRLQVQSSAEEVRVLGAMQVPASLHVFDFHVGVGEVRLNVSAPDGSAIGSLFVPETDLRPGFGGNIEMDLTMAPSDVQVLRSQVLDLLLGHELSGSLRAEGSVSSPSRFGARSEGRAGFEVPLLLAAVGLSGSARLGSDGEHVVLSLAELLGGDAAASPVPSQDTQPEPDQCSTSFGVPSLLKLEVVGGDEVGRPLVLPCLQACPDGSAEEDPAKQFGARLAVEFAARLPCLLRMPYVLELPALSAQVAGRGVASAAVTLAQVSTGPFSYRSREDEWSRLELNARVTDTPSMSSALASAVAGCQDQAFEVYARGDSGSLLDSLLSVLHVELEPSIRSGGATEDGQADGQPDDENFANLDLGDPVAPPQSRSSSTWYYPTARENTWRLMETSSSHATLSVRLPSGLATRLACAWQDSVLQLTNEYGQALASWVESCGNLSDGAVVYGTLHGYAGKHVVQQVMDAFVIGSGTGRVDATANLSYTTSLGLAQSIVMPASISRSLLDELDGSSCRRLSEMPRRLEEPVRASRRPWSHRQGQNETGRRLTQEALNINEMNNDFSSVLEQGTVSVQSVWESAINILWSDVEIDLKNWAMNNIFALGVGIRSFDVRMSLDDADGASTGSVVSLWSYDPIPAFQFVHVVQTYDDFLVDAAHRRVFPELVVRIDNDWETMVRLYDEMVGHGRLCAKLDVVATAYLQSPGQDAYVLEGLELEVPKVGMYGVDPCGVEVVCEEVFDQVLPAESESLQSFTMVNSADVVGGAVELASSTGDGGATWSVSRVAVVDSWVASFEFKVSNGCVSTWLGCVPTTGGHGFAFVLQSGPGNVAASGNDGGGGYSGIDNSIGVMLHTYAGYSKLYVYKNGRTGGGEEIATAALPSSVDGGSWQSAKIVYSSVSGHMWVYIQSMEVALTTLQIDMDFADQAGEAHVGFTASNPWYEGWSTFEVRNLNFDGAGTSVQHSNIAEDGLTIGPAGSTASFTVVSYTSCDRRKLSGGDSWRFELVKGAEILHLVPDSSVPHSIRDDHDGTYNVTFLAASAGAWTVKGATSSVATMQAMGTVIVS